MATLRWDRVTWDDFRIGLLAYRDVFSGRRGEDFAYLRCLNELRDCSMSDRAVRAVHIVTFLIAWKCRLKPLESRVVLRDWIRDNADRLEALLSVELLGDEMPALAGEVKALYDDLMVAGRAAVANWSDAATSKALHQLVPPLFVMWDVNIKPFASDYGDFVLEMHGLGRRIIGEAGLTPSEAEAYLQAQLGYCVRKTMSKYLDEYNWYELVGSARTGE